MDSLTQIVLGAAVGEAVLGRRVGNRAMVWGGLAGTLPDLDVLSGAVTDPMSALAFHRAFTHSLAFALLAAPIIGYAVNRMYADPPGKWRVAAGVTALLWGVILVGSLLMPVPVYGIPAIATAITLVFAGLAAGILGWQHWRGGLTAGPRADARGWTLLFFGAIVTHPLLDCFTAYGTQFFEPLSSVRLAWNTVSVVDPLYTLPFLLLLLFAARAERGARVRSRLNRAGLVVSSAYLLLTVANAYHVGAVVDATLERRAITADRSFHSPTLGNNLLWSATVQAGDDYYIGQYSLLDAERDLSPFVRVPGNHGMLQPYADERAVEILTWFSNGYYTVFPGAGDTLLVCDLRYGYLGDDATDPGAYLFQWAIDTTARPLNAVQRQFGARSDGSALFGQLWTRLKGVE